MAIITRLLPFWKTTLKDNCQRAFPQIFRWFEQFFKPKQIEFSSSHQSAAPAPPPIKPVQQQNLLKPEGKMNLTQVARLVTQLSSKQRTPSIKFLGPRSPKPKYDANKYPMKIQASKSSSSSSTIVSSAPKISSIGKIGTTPKGSGIDESQLPRQYRRRPIDEEEIAIINNGGRL